MKIGLITPDFPRGDEGIPSGVVRYTRTVAEALAKVGHQPIIFTSDLWIGASGEKDKSTFMFLEGPSSSLVKVPVVVLPFISMSNWAMHVHEALLDMSVDVVESHSCAAPLIFEQLVGGTPVVIRVASGVEDSFLSGDVEIYEDRKRFMSQLLLERKTVLMADVVVTASIELAARVKGMGVNPIELPLGLPDKAYVKVETEKEYDLCIVVSRVTDKRKGGDLVETFLSFLEDEDKHVVVIGELLDSREQERLSDRWKGVEFHFEPVSDRDLREFYSASKAALVPSRSESFGLCYMEAMAQGTPVIAFSQSDKTSWPMLFLPRGEELSKDDFLATFRWVETLLGDVVYMDKVKSFVEGYRMSSLVNRYVEVYKKAMVERVKAGRLRGW